MSVKLIYKDIAVGADEDADISSSGALSISDVSLLPFGSDNGKQYVTLERNLWTLDGSKVLYDGGSVSFWSELLSDENGEFSTHPTILVEFDEQYTSQGIYFNFGKDWCSSVKITWYRNSTVLSQQTFAPTSTTYFCENQVTAYNKVFVEILKTSLPYHRARIDSILFGVVREFERDSLRGVKITEEIDPISRRLPYSTLDWKLLSRQNVNFIFQKKQPVEVRENNRLLGVFYISDSDRLSTKNYDINCIDAIGVLDDIPFTDAYYSNKNAFVLSQDICTGFNVEMDASLQSKTVSGILKNQTCRGALQQLCFAIGAVAATEGTDKIRIFKLETHTANEIPKNRTRLENSVKQSAIITSVNLTSHSYSTSGSTGEVEIGGIKYYDTTNVVTITNPLITATDKQNIIDITDATLISPQNVEEIAQLVYDFYMRRDTHHVKFRVDGERIGDYVTTHTLWGDTVTGHYTKASITLSGIVVSDAEVIGE